MWSDWLLKAALAAVVVVAAFEIVVAIMMREMLSRLLNAMTTLTALLREIRRVRKDFGEGLALQREIVEFLNAAADEAEKPQESPAPQPVIRRRQPTREAQPARQASPLEEEDDFDELPDARPGVPLNDVNSASSGLVRSRRELDRR